MASTFARPVMFAKEPNLFLLYAKLNFAAAGAVSLDTAQSKGFCNVSQNTLTFTATTSTNTTLSVVSSFAGLYVGMALSGTGVAAGTTISSMNAGAATITINNATTASAAGVTITATGGYVLQLGQQAGVRLDTYNKILGMAHSFDVSGAQGGAGVLALAPAAPAVHIVRNKIAIRTIPSTAASVLSDATVSFITGAGSGTSFVLANPGNGEILRLSLFLGNSTAP